MDFALISIGTNPMWHLEDGEPICGVSVAPGIVFEHLPYTTHRRYSLEQAIEFQLFSGRTVCTDCLTIARARELLASDESIRGALSLDG